MGLCRTVSDISGDSCLKNLIFHKPLVFNVLAENVTVRISGVESIVKYGGQGQSGQAVKMFQITPYINDFQTSNNPGS